MGGNVVTIESEIENKQIDTLLQVQNSSLSTQKLLTRDQQTSQSWYNLRSWNFNTLEMAF